MTDFVEVQHEGVEPTALVPASALEHYARAGWTPVEESDAAPEPDLPDGDPSAEWTRAQLDDYAARRLSLDTSDERTKGDVLARIQAVIAAQHDNTTDTPVTGADNEES